jgi:anti-anti-sigma factor
LVEEPDADSPTGELTIVVPEALEARAVDRWGRLIRDTAARRPHRLVLDLRGVARIDETALVMLLQVHRGVIRTDGRLILRGPTPAVRRMLALGRIDRVLEIEDSAG